VSKVHRILINYIFFFLIFSGIFIPAKVNAQFATYNHPELNWKSFETDHFEIHYHEGAEWTAWKSADIAEAVYGPVTSFYNYEPDQKTDLIIKDIGDNSNGAAYYYDNKIEIWATPLDYPLRGNHYWLLDVITHEFTHIVSLQKSMKYTRSIPGFYFQVIDYEDEKRDDVVYGYPRVISSYLIPGLVIPMWLAEGMAQFMYPGTTNDLWDSHRDMLLRDRTLHKKVLSFSQMASFGKRGIGNESTYNQGYAFVRYLSDRFGPDVIPRLADIISNPVQFSINNALKKATGVPGKQIYNEWVQYLETYYGKLAQTILQNQVIGDILIGDATTQYYPEWSGDSLIYYLSNRGRDYFMQTSLYAYDVNTKKSKLIQPKVLSRISVAPDGKSIYYSKSSKPDKQGCVFFDIYRYDLQRKKEKQITKYARAYNPAISPNGKQLAFVSGRDGTSNLFIMNMDSMTSKKVTDYSDGLEIFTAHWSPDGRQIAFDYMTDHGRNIAVYHVADGKFDYIDTEHYDSRNPFFSPDGKWLYYACDKTGIFNIYRKSLGSGAVELVTNVVGGAQMPSVNQKGELLYSLFDDSSFKIAMIEEPREISNEIAQYFNYSETVPNIMAVAELERVKPVKYKDKFSKMFIMPRVMIDYGTVKPGFYFSSSEILDRFNIFGGASVNSIKDRDLMLSLEYHQWYPTIYLEFNNISRSILNKKTTYNGYPIEVDYTFYLTEALAGISVPMSGINQLRFDVSWSKYRTATDEKIPSAGIYSNGFTYDYYRGVDFKLNWLLKKVVPTLNQFTNPDNGIILNTNIYRNYDKFLKDFGVNEDFGTLAENFRKNYYWKIEHEGEWRHKYPVVNKLVGTLKWRAGWISKYDIDTFFNFFAGGMPGLRGYPFYSMEGRNLFSLHYTWRIPLFREKDIQILPFNLQNAFLATYVETGNAWNKVKGYPGMNWSDFTLNTVDIVKSITSDFKSDIGIQLRLSGFSFYAYPTAISLDFVYGIDEFTIVDRQDVPHQYGREWRTYLTILFGL